MAVEVEYNGFTFEFPEGTSDSDIYKFLETSSSSMMENYSDEPEEAKVEVPEALRPVTSTEGAFSQEGLMKAAPEKNIQPSINPRIESLWETTARQLSGEEIPGSDTISFWEGDSRLGKGMGGAGKGDADNILYDGLSNKETRDLIKGDDPRASEEEVDKKFRDRNVDNIANAAKLSTVLIPGGQGVMGMAGMGAVAGAADAGIDVIADSVKGERDFLDSDNLVDVAKGAGTGGALGGIFGGVLKGAEKLVGLLKKSPTVTDDIAELADQYGIKLTPGQEVDSKTIQYLEDLTAEGLGGRSIVKAREEQVVAAEEIANRNVDSAKGYFINEVMEQNPEVRTLRKNLSSNDISSEERHLADLRHDELYEEASRKVSEDGHILNAVPRAMEEKRQILSKAYEDSLKTLDEDIVRTYGQAVEPPIPRTKKLADEVVAEEKRLGSLSKGVEKPVSGIAQFAPKSFSDMDLMKRNLNDKANTAFNKGEHGASKKFSALSKAVKDDMDDFASQIGSKTDDYNQLDKDWAEFSELKGSPLLKSLQRKEFGEDVWSTLRSGASKDSKVEKFVKLVGDNKPVKKALTTKYMEDALVAAKKSGSFSIQDYTKFLKDNGSALKHFDEVAYEKNQGLVKLMSKLAEGEKATASAASQGPWAGIMTKLAPSIIGGAAGGYGGGMEGALAGAAGGAMGRAGLAKVGLPALSRIVSEKPFKFTEYLRTKKASKLLVEATEANSKKLEQLLDKLLKGYLIYEDK